MGLYLSREGIRVVIIFLVLAIAVGFLARIVFSSDGDDAASSPPSRPAESNSGQVEQQTVMPSEQTPTPGASSSPAAPEGNVKVTPTEVANFLREYNTFTWIETPMAFEERMVKVGAIAGSEASESYVNGYLLDACMANKCSIVAEEVAQVKIDDKTGMAKAEVLVTLNRLEDVSQATLNCQLELAPVSLGNKGKFAYVLCFGLDEWPIG